MRVSLWRREQRADVITGDATMFTLDASYQEGDDEAGQLGFSKRGVDHRSKLLPTISGADIMRPEPLHATHLSSLRLVRLFSVLKPRSRGAFILGLASNSPPACGPAGYLNGKRLGSELGRKVAVDFKSDADFHECGSCPVHSCLLPFIMARNLS